MRACVCGCSCGELIWTRSVWPNDLHHVHVRVAIWGCQPTDPIPRQESKSESPHCHADPEPVSRLPNSLVPNGKLRSSASQIVRLWWEAVGIEPRPPSPRAYALITRLQGRGGGGVSGLKSAFNLSRPYHQLKVGFGSVCGCRCGDLIWISFVCLGRTIYARQFLGAKPPTQFRNR